MSSIGVHVRCWGTHADEVSSLVCSDEGVTTMTTYEHEIEIDAPTEYAFEWGCEPENWQRCMPALTDVEHIEETDDGTRYRTTFKMLGRSMISESRFEIAGPNAHAVSHIQGDMAGEMHYHYTETDAGTNLRFVAEFEDAESRFERALQPVLKRYMDRQFRNHVKTTKDLVEAEYEAKNEIPAQ